MNELYDFKFNVVELNVILKGLKKLPYEESAGIIQKVVEEHTLQLKEKEKSAKKEKLSKTES